MDPGAFLVVMVIAGLLSGRIFARLKLPSIIGMMLLGILVGAFFQKSIPALLWEMEPFLKSLALIVILLRAGIGLRWSVLKRAGISAILMSFIPCILEGLAVIAATRYMFGFSWIVSGMTGFMIAAVSPAIVVPSMLEIVEKQKNGESTVPTMILAGASVDDVFAITLFTIFLNLGTTGQADYSGALLSIPVSIGGGIGFGLVLGLILADLFHRHYEKIRATEKTIMLLCLSFLFTRIGEYAHIAALLGVMTAGFIIMEKTEKTGREISLKLAKIWVLAEVILFVLIGLAVDVSVAVDAGLRGLGVIAIGLVFRSVGVWLATIPSGLSAKERLFCIIAYIPKATVQAALGSIPLSAGILGGEIILSLAVISVLITAPLGLLGIRTFGSKLLGIMPQGD